MQKMRQRLSKLFRHSPPPEPERIKDSGIKTYDVDAILRKLGDPYDPAYLSPQKEQEQLPYGEWRCGYCDHVNKTEMLDCHFCGAKKPKQHTQDCPSFPMFHNLCQRIEM